MVAAFLLISAIAHFLVASPWLYPWYVRNLRARINYVRWYEYALSSSVMIVVNAMLSNVLDLPTLVLLFSSKRDDDLLRPDDGAESDDGTDELDGIHPATSVHRTVDPSA